MNTNKKYANVRIIIIIIILLCGAQRRPALTMLHAPVVGGENKTCGDRNSGGGSRQKVRKRWNVCSGIETDGYRVALNKIKKYREKRWRRWCRWIGDEFGQVEIRYRDIHTHTHVDTYIHIVYVWRARARVCVCGYVNGAMLCVWNQGQWPKECCRLARVSECACVL